MDTATVVSRALGTEGLHHRNLKIMGTVMEESHAVDMVVHLSC